MTTPAHCTHLRMGLPHAPHGTVGPPEWFCPGLPEPSAEWWEAGVEPPADVQATPDPRLDVVAQVLYENLHVTVGSGDFVAQRILDALDAMRPDEPDPTGLTVPCHGCHDPSFHTAHLAPGALDRLAPAPAGLSAAQEIRLRVLKVASECQHLLNWVDLGTEGVARDLLVMADVFAAWVERGPDDESRVEGLTLALAAWRQRVERVEAERDLAEARLGHIAGALRDYENQPDLGAEFRIAVADCLGWDPDNDAMTPGMPDPCQPIGCDNGYHLPGCTYAEPDDTAPAGEERRESDEEYHQRIQSSPSVAINLEEQK